jgi:hypothetical protein
VVAPGEQPVPSDSLRPGGLQWRVASSIGCSVRCAVQCSVHCAAIVTIIYPPGRQELPPPPPAPPPAPGPCGQPGCAPVQEVPLLPSQPMPITGKDTPIYKQARSHCGHPLDSVQCMPQVLLAEAAVGGPGPGTGAGPNAGRHRHALLTDLTCMHRLDRSNPFGSVKILFDSYI